MKQGTKAKIPGHEVSVQPGPEAGAAAGRGAALVAGAGVVAAALAGVALHRFPGGGASSEDRFDAAGAVADVRSVVADGTPRVVGTPGAAAGRDRIVGLLERAGLTVERPHATIVRRSGERLELENLVAVVPARDTAARGHAPVGLVAHTDSAPRAPGAGDDASGVACVLGVARSLLADPPEHDVLLLLTDGEEAGLLGAQAFVSNDARAKGLRAVVNLDARGAAGPAYVFETGPETAWLAERMAESLSHPRTMSLAVEAYRRMPNGTDFTVFLRAGVTGYNIAFIGDVGAYHTPEDVPERLRPETLAHMGQTALELVRALDRSLPPDGQPIPAGRAVFGDVLGQGILRWPEAWTAALASGAAFLLAAAAVWGIVRSDAVPGETRPGRRAALAVAACVVALLGAVGVAWGLGAAAGAAGVRMGTAPGRVIGIDIAIWTAAFVLAIGTGVFLAGRRAAPWAVLLGAWAPWCALAVAAAFALPAVAMPFVVPVAVAAVVAAAVRAARVAPARGATWCAAAGSLAASFSWLPLEPAFMDAFGVGLAPANGLRAALVALTFVPLVVTWAAPAATQTAPAQGGGRQERDRLGSNQQPSVS